MGKNFVQRQKEEQLKWAKAGRINEQLYCFDIMTLALGRIGFRSKRLKEFEKIFQETYMEYNKLHQTDFKDDKDCWYYKEVMDREMRDYLGEDMKSYDERHYLEVHK